MDKNILSSNESLIVGAGKLASAVSTTMGAKGSFVVIQDYQNMTPTVTKDGVTVANAVDLENPHEMMGAKLLREASNKMLNEVGDGTTTVTVLANALLDTKGMSPRLATETYLKDLRTVTKEVRTLSKKTTKKQLKEVATLSANGDKEIGSLVSQAFLHVGEYGAVMVEDSFSPVDNITFEEGFNIDQGWVNQFFITNSTNLTSELDNPLVLVTSDKIERFENLLEIMEVSSNLKRPLLIVADDIEDKVLHNLVLNHNQGRIKCCVIRSPKFGEQREKLIQDICFMTGAKAENMYNNSYSPNNLGEATKAIVKAHSTSLILPQPEGFEEHLEHAKKDITDDIQFNKYRVNILTGKMATIKVGGMTPASQKERRDRFDDAVGATRSAFKFGVVPGAGNTLAFLAETLDISPAFKAALKKPMETIYKNAELSFEGKVEFNKGYDVSDNSFKENLKDNGIVDSTLSVTKALEVATSVANTLIQTKVSIKVLN